MIFRLCNKYVDKCKIYAFTFCLRLYAYSINVRVALISQTVPLFMNTNSGYQQQRLGKYVGSMYKTQQDQFFFIHLWYLPININRSGDRASFWDSVSSILRTRGSCVVARTYKYHLRLCKQVVERGRKIQCCYLDFEEALFWQYWMSCCLGRCRGWMGGGGL